MIAGDRNYFLYKIGNGADDRIVDGSTLDVFYENILSRGHFEVKLEKERMTVLRLNDTYLLNQNGRWTKLDYIVKKKTASRIAALTFGRTGSKYWWDFCATMDHIVIARRNNNCGRDMRFYYKFSHIAGNGKWGYTFGEFSAPGKNFATENQLCGRTLGIIAQIDHEHFSDNDIKYLPATRCVIEEERELNLYSLQLHDPQEYIQTTTGYIILPSIIAPEKSKEGDE